LNSIAPFNINPISQTPAIKPEDVIQYVSDELDYGLRPMKADERMLYAQEHIEIQKKIQEAQQPAQPEQQIPQMPQMPQLPDAPIELPMVA
jgi:hypothetical protein